VKLLQPFKAPTPKLPPTSLERKEKASEAKRKNPPFLENHRKTTHISLSNNPPKMPNLRTLYRTLLRELPPRPLLTTPRSPLHQRLRDSFSSQKNDLNPHLAEQLATYLRSQRTYGALLERYNPGMNMEQDERVRLTARKVGMDLPVEFGEGEKK